MIMKKKNNKKIIIISLVVITIVGIFSVFFASYSNKKNIENKLVQVTTDYYEKEFIEYMPTLLKRNGTLQITLNTLKQLEKDVTFFEKKQCNLENTYVTLTYNEKTEYSIDIHLDCN